MRAAVAAPDVHIRTLADHLERRRVTRREAAASREGEPQMPRVRAAIVLLIAALAACVAAARPRAGRRRRRAALAARAGHRRELLLRHGRPLRERRHGNDPAGSAGDPLVSGFDPTARGFYNGGDLKGLLSQHRLHPRASAPTSIWLTPSFKNKAVQLEDGPSAGYHGYWITDFTQIDPHLGTNADLRALVDAAHARGMKVYFDIITNHTADVIGYEEGARQPYVSKDVVPYRDAVGHGRSTTATTPARRRFPPLDPDDVASRTRRCSTRPSRTSRSRPGSTTSRSTTTAATRRSSARTRCYGDFFGLDDLFTEHPRVVDGHDRHLQDVDPRLRRRRLPHRHDEARRRRVLAAVRAARCCASRARRASASSSCSARSSTPRRASRRTSRRRDRMQAVLDFPFQDAARDFASRGSRDRPARDVLRRTTTGTPTPTRTSTSCRRSSATTTWAASAASSQADNPGAGDAEWLARDRLAHELMYFSRGNPVIYYGDEQGFTGAGGDQVARQTCSPARCRTTSTTTCSAPTRRTRRTTSTPRTRCTGRSPASPR